MQRKPKFDAFSAEDVAIKKAREKEKSKNTIRLLHELVAPLVQAAREFKLEKIEEHDGRPVVFFKMTNKMSMFSYAPPGIKLPDSWAFAINSSQEGERTLITFEKPLAIPLDTFQGREDLSSYIPLTFSKPLRWNKTPPITEESIKKATEAIRNSGSSLDRFSHQLDAYSYAMNKTFFELPKKKPISKKFRKKLSEIVKEQTESLTSGIGDWEV